MERIDGRPAGGSAEKASAYQPSKPVANQDDAGESSGPAPAGGNEGGSFDCNICLELAQDPVVTLCGHLFCWPCLYRWLHARLMAKDCPVCKATVEEEKVIPLYGRGKVGSVDPRTKAVPGVDIPHRPAGQRPETAARHPEQSYHHPFGFGFMGAPVPPAATARFGNVTLSAGFGLFPSLFGFHVHGYTGSAGIGAPPGFPFGAGLQGNQFQPASPAPTHDQQQEAVLSRLLLFLGCFVVFCLMFF
ncbi:hypothetical protein O6H91_07G008800 [Diphasiastrum complanatum]|uniref:Uncharacterized protein n=1 Tax=Diphasiastrum complanatum TaxID=34168 RepID=A0ACC2D2P6_DIPCM|nr:hypothetical protein O6H91_07G008800 [Diphasiastrum complanatum]